MKSLCNTSLVKSGMFHFKKIPPYFRKVDAKREKNQFPISITKNMLINAKKIINTQRTEAGLSFFNWDVKPNNTVSKKRGIGKHETGFNLDPTATKRPKGSIEKLEITRLPSRHSVRLMEERVSDLEKEIKVKSEVLDAINEQIEKFGGNSKKNQLLIKVIIKQNEQNKKLRSERSIVLQQPVCT